MRFYLGIHHPNWLWEVGIPFFVSHRTLRKRKTPFPRAWGPWCLDSGGFTEVSKYGKWRTGVGEYIEAVERYQEELGNLVWAAPQDWMCEPHIIEKTGLSVEIHQKLTVENYLELRGQGPFIPVLQGWELKDYLECIVMYDNAGVDLTREPVVGVGSVCRRQSTSEAKEIFAYITDLGVKVHGFGVKVSGLREYGHLLESADSMAWSFAARWEPPLPGCEGHKRCNNCRRYAVRWWADIQYTI